MRGVRTPAPLLLELSNVGAGQRDSLRLYDLRRTHDEESLQVRTKAFGEQAALVEGALGDLVVVEGEQNCSHQSRYDAAKGPEVIIGRQNPQTDLSPQERTLGHAESISAMTPPPAGPLLDDAGAWLRGVRRSPSPNCDPRPDGVAVDLLVVHAISLPPGCFGTSCIEDFFLNRLDARADPFFATIASLRVSAHAVIARDGVLTQYVPFTMRAWHAGVSCFQGRERCNDFSVGIELEGCDDIPYTAPQYRSLGALCAVLMRPGRPSRAIAL